MISSISWVPKGVAKSLPTAAEPPSKEEIDEILKAEALKKRGIRHHEGVDEAMEEDSLVNISNVAHALAVAEAVGRASISTNLQAKFDGITNALEELDMDNYDEEDESIQLFGTGIGESYYPSNDMDPYLDKDDEDTEELEDLVIRPEDFVIICARNEDEVSHLEVWILEESDDGANMYVHHDIIIPAFPLCTAWLDCPLKGGERGNFVAVGSMEPAIEVWDLDVLDEVQPCKVLGGISKKNTKKGKKMVKFRKGSHRDSVLGLDWNKEYRNLLASGSADKLVKIWDVVAEKCETTMEHHTDKVQAVAWNHHAPQVLLSGSFDHLIVMKDGRMPLHNGFTWPVQADVECLKWDPHKEHSFVVSLEDGMVQGFDIRNAASNLGAEQKPSFMLHAHDKAVCSVSYNAMAPNLLATGSTDKMVKLWDLSDDEPKCIVSHNPMMGAIFSISFCGDNPFLLALGGSEGKLDVWDASVEMEVCRRFSSYMRLKR